MAVSSMPKDELAAAGCCSLFPVKYAGFPELDAPPKGVVLTDGT